MAIKMKFTSETFRKAGAEMMARIETAIIRRLAYAGEQCVNFARSLPPDVGFGDVTGNLRNSIGYMILKDGKNIADSFEGGGQGASSGQSVAAEIGRKYTNGFALVVVAGMDYAVYVEAMGRDVLTGATRLAESTLPASLKELERNVSEAILERQ
jgi:hypothetical protein